MEKIINTNNPIKNDADESNMLPSGEIKAVNINPKHKISESVYKKISGIGKKNLIIFGSILLIGGAITVNWILFSGNADGNYSSGVTDGNGDAGITDSSGGDITIGQSQFVSSDDEASADSYFQMTQINRQRARDEAMEVLQIIVDNGEALEEVKTQAMNDINAIAANIENEANIESLIMAKGFAECVAVVSDANANIIVKSEGLMPNEIAQIKEIVCEQSGISPNSVKIIQKN